MDGRVRQVLCIVSSLERELEGVENRHAARQRVRVWERGRENGKTYQKKLKV